MRSVSRKLLRPAEVVAPVVSAEASYRVIVDLDQQSLPAFGRDFPLGADMTLKANIVFDRRSLLDWVLDPLRSLRGGAVMTARALWARRLPDIRQSEAAECGLACLAMIAAYHGQQIDLGSAAPPLSGLAQGHDAGRASSRRQSASDLAGRPLRLEPVSLARLRLPAILHWDMTPFRRPEADARNGLAVDP